MIEIRPERYYLGFWFCELPNNTGNLLLCASRPLAEPTNWYVVWRFRYYRDTKVFDSDDLRNWYSGSIQGETPEQVETQLNYVVKNVAQAAGSVYDFYPARCAGEELQRKLSTNPPVWIQIKEERADSDLNQIREV